MKYIIEVKTEVDKNCCLTEYYKGIDEEDNVVLTPFVEKAAKLSEKVCEDIIDYLAVALAYLPRKLTKLEI